MKVTYQKKFLKELAKIPAKRRAQIEKFVFEEVPRMKSLAESGNIEQITDYPGYYKARFGDYRVGIKVKDAMVSFERVLHRKEIYRFFP